MIPRSPPTPSGLPALPPLLALQLLLLLLPRPAMGLVTVMGRAVKQPNQQTGRATLHLLASLLTIIVVLSFDGDLATAHPRPLPIPRFPPQRPHTRLLHLLLQHRHLPMTLVLVVMNPDNLRNPQTGKVTLPWLASPLTTDNVEGV